MLPAKSLLPPNAMHLDHVTTPNSSSEGADNFLQQLIPTPAIPPRSNHHRHQSLNHIYMGNSKETIDTLLSGQHKELWTKAVSNELG